MVVQDERWRLVVSWRDGKRAGQQVAAYPLIGLDERAVCRAFGFKGSHVPTLPVPVHAEHIAQLQPFASRQIVMPNGTKGELFLDSDATSARDVVPLFVVAVLAGAAAVGLWAWASATDTGWLALVLHVASIAAGLLAAWTVISMLLVLMVLRGQRIEAQLAAPAMNRRRRR